MDVLIAIAIVALAWVLLSWRKHNQNVTRIQACDLIDRQLVGLIEEFPALNNEQIATLARDEMLNVRISNRDALTYASEETVGRLRRTLVVQAGRAKR